MLYPDRYMLYLVLITHLLHIVSNLLTPLGVTADRHTRARNPWLLKMSHDVMDYRGQSTHLCLDPNYLFSINRVKVLSSNVKYEKVTDQVERLLAELRCAFGVTSWGLSKESHEKLGLVNFNRCVRKKAIFCFQNEREGWVFLRSHEEGLSNACLIKLRCSVHSRVTKYHHSRICLDLKYGAHSKFQ